MRNSHFQLRGLQGLCPVLILLVIGCEGESRSGLDKPAPRSAEQLAPKAEPAVEPVAKAAAGQPAKGAPSKQVPLGKGVWFEAEGNRRRVLVEATVCLREGGLECLLCRRHSKEHESILATQADARDIHAALLAAGAKPGSPVQYVEKKGEVVIVPPTGSRIKILVRYEAKGKVVTVPAQSWILNAKTKKDLEDEWVFAGSQFLPGLNEEKQKPVYAATSDGSYICVYNMPYAMLDLPVNNPNKDPEIRELQPQTERIPPIDTKVILILEPEG
ncbi:MAG TPA: YdjY domain-containing protein [Gemmataceae bacterium]|nr:YdjY domain-containing protein [Gemmataceae bacterium]